MSPTSTTATETWEKGNLHREKIAYFRGMTAFLSTRHWPTATLAWLFILALPGSGHHFCPGVEITLDTLSPGEVEQSIYYYNVNYYERDTFYQAELFDELLNRFDTNRYAIIGQITDVDSTLFFDTLVIYDTIRIPIHTRSETVRLSMHYNLKDSVPERDLTLREQWVYNPEDSISFFTALDTPFIAFFNSYQTLGEMGLRPSLDCFREPTVYFIINGYIHKKGLGRMPGVSVPLTDLAKATNSFPELKQIQRADAMYAFLVPDPLRLETYNIYNILGRLVRSGRLAGPHDLDIDLNGLPGGFFILEYKGRGGTLLRRVGRIR